MKRFKKGLLIGFLFVLSLTLIGCSSASGGSSEGADNEKPIQVSFGHGFMQDTPHHKAVEKFKEEVEDKTDGKLNINIFPSGQLGTAREMFEGLQMGTQEMALVPTARISGFVPELQMFDLPFLFPSREVAYKLMDGEVGQELLAKMDQQGIKGVAFYEDGFKHFTSNTKIEKLEDFNGVKFRTMESPIIMEQFKSLGASPVPIAFSELYNSLQLGVVDGQENPLVTIEKMKFYEVQDYLILSEHAYLGHVLIFSKDWFEGLDKETQDMLVETGRSIATWQREQILNEEVEYLKTIEESGTEIIKLTDEDKETMREATKKVHQEYIDLFGDEILNKAYDEMK